jgi:ribosomal protein S18 acetylase RimI-like enzyme
MIALHIIQAENKMDREQLRLLLEEYLEWLSIEVGRSFGVQVEVAEMIEANMAELENFLPPRGALVLAMDGEEAVGMGGLRPATSDIAEIKRMYVRPGYRGQRLGRRILDRLVEEARASGYRYVRLDSAPFMRSAHAIYRAAGFKEVQPFAGTEIPEHLHHECLFMMLEL